MYLINAILGGTGGIVTQDNFNIQTAKYGISEQNCLSSVNFWRFQGSVTAITEVFHFLPLNHGLRSYLRNFYGWLATLYYAYT